MKTTVRITLTLIYIVALYKTVTFLYSLVYPATFQTEYRSVQDDFNFQGTDELQRSKAPADRQVHLITQFYFDKNPVRHQELCTALVKNILNSEIHTIHLIQRDRSPEKLKQSIYDAVSSVPTVPKLDSDSFSRKVQIVNTVSPNDRLLASDAFTYASKYLRNEIAILANLDIYFDDSLKFLTNFTSETPRNIQDMLLGMYCAYFLSRYEVDEADSIGTQCGPKFMGSHDSFVFVPPLPSRLVKQCAFELGTYGIESRIMWEFEQFGITVRNPCFDIKSWHLHKSGVKNKQMPEVNLHNKSSIAFPSRL